MDVERIIKETISEAIREAAKIGAEAGARAALDAVERQKETASVAGDHEEGPAADIDLEAPVPGVTNTTIDFPFGDGVPVFIQGMQVSHCAASLSLM